MMYLLLAPGHPRGRTDMHAVFEADGSDKLWVHTHGLDKLGLNEVEFVGVPVPLRGYAHGLLFEIMGYTKFEKPIQPNEHFGGHLAHPDQRVSHYATVRRIDRPDDPDHDGFLRLVDYGCSEESGFPRRLFAAHIGSLAERRRSAVTRERLARLALQTYEATPEEWRNEADVDRNPGNWLAWETLGHALYDQGRELEGERCFKEVVERCPAAAARIYEIYAKGVSSGHLPPPEADSRSRFWLSLDPETLRKAATSRGSAADEGAQSS